MEWVTHLTRSLKNIDCQRKSAVIISLGCSCAYALSPFTRHADWLSGLGRPSPSDDMPGSSRSRARNLDNAPDLAAVSLRRSVPAARTSQPVKRRHPSPSNGGGGGGGGSGNGEHTQQRQRHRTARKSKPVCWASLRLLSAPVQRAVTPLSHGSASGVSESSSEPSTPGTHLLDGESDSESGRSTPTSSQEKSLISLFATSTLIGRSSKCDVCVNDARVSSRHCIIERDSSTRRPYLTNLSRNGITISSQGRSTKLRSKGQAVPLEDKDTLMLVWEKPTLTYEFRFTKPRTLESESVLFAVRSNQHVSFTFNFDLVPLWQVCCWETAWEWCIRDGSTCARKTQLPSVCSENHRNHKVGTANRVCISRHCVAATTSHSPAVHSAQVPNHSRTTRAGSCHHAQITPPTYHPGV